MAAPWKEPNVAGRIAFDHAVSSGSIRALQCVIAFSEIKKKYKVSHYCELVLSLLCKQMERSMRPRITDQTSCALVLAVQNAARALYRMFALQSV